MRTLWFKNQENPSDRISHAWAPLSAQWQITGLDGAESLKCSHRMGDGQIFLKNRRSSSFNKDLSNEPNFGRIHLAGQYL
jgi:hypothetical protein